MFIFFQFDIDFMRLWFPYIVGGVTYTLILSFGGMALAIPLALLGALGRLSRSAVLNTISAFYVSFFRGTPLGMPTPERGISTRVLSEERIPILDVGLIGALKRREITIVPAVESFDGADVALRGGTRLAPHAVIAATGFHRSLKDLVGHLSVLDEKGTPVVHGGVTHPFAPNLFFIGYSNPLSGNLRELGIDARRIARAVTAEGF